LEYQQPYHDRMVMAGLFVCGRGWRLMQIDE
jgi:hypothetical protein